MSTSTLSPLQLVALVAAGVVLLVAFLLALLALRAAGRRSRELTEALDRAEGRANELADRLTRLEEQAPRPEPPTIHHAVVVDRDSGEPLDGQVVAERIDGRLFTDIVAREAAVKAASWTHGVRRALAPEVRSRIRFEVRRELKRARKQRRADLKAAMRDFQARERAATRPDREARDEGDAA